ncbi:unnamed protein product, partial [Didymodactylos carnosus]
MNETTTLDEGGQEEEEFSAPDQAVKVLQQTSKPPLSQSLMLTREKLAVSRGDEEQHTTDSSI